MSDISKSARRYVCPACGAQPDKRCVEMDTHKPVDYTHVQRMIRVRKAK